MKSERRTLAEQAATNLKKETGLPWMCEQMDNDHYQVCLSKDYKGIGVEEFNKKFMNSGLLSLFQKPEAKKIDFLPQVFKQGNKVIDAIFDNPVEIESIANGKYKNPNVDENLLSKSSKALQKVLAKETPYESEVTYKVKNPKDEFTENEIIIHSSVSAGDEMEARNLFKQAIENLTYSAKVIKSEFQEEVVKGEKNRYRVTASISNPCEIEAISQWEKSYYISPDVARALYIAVTSKMAGQNEQLKEFNDLKNDPSPDKFHRALEILNIPVAKENISFHGRNGYDVVMDRKCYDAIQSYLNPEAENVLRRNMS